MMQSNPVEQFSGTDGDRVGPDRYSAQPLVKSCGYSFGKSTTIRNPFKKGPIDVGPGQ